MKIVIAGLPKSGTTALLYKIKNSLQGDAKILFEPKKYKYSASKENIIAKILIDEKNSDVLDCKQFNNFDKKILIVRDPRDRLISSLMYDIRDSKFYKEEAKTEEFISLLREKEQNPSKVAVIDLIKLYNQLNNDKFDKKTIETHLAAYLKRAIIFHNKYSDYFMLKYEDFIDGKINDLEEYLGFKLKGEAKVDDSLKRVERTKTYGNWKNWFTNKDTSFFKTPFKRYMKQYGYEDDWKTNENKVILPKHCSEYAIRITKERQEDDKRDILRSQIIKLNEIITLKDKRLNILREREQQLNNKLKEKEHEFKNNLERINNNLERINNLIKVKENLIIQEKKLNQSQNNQIVNLNKHITNIESSLTWKALRKYQRLVDTLIPRGTKIRNLYDSLIINNRAKTTPPLPKENLENFWENFELKSPKILFINHEETLTGAPKILFEIAKNFKNKYKIAILSKTEGVMHKQFIKEFKQIIYPKRIYPNMNWHDHEIAKQILMRVKPELVYVNSAVGYEYAFEAKKLGIPVIFHIHELDWGLNSSMGNKKEEINQNADLFIAVSEKVYNLLISKMGCPIEKVKLVHEFIDPEEIIKKSKEKSEDEIYLELKKEAKEKIVVCLGSFVPRKGADVMMEAYKILKDKNTKLVWIGSHNYPVSIGLLEQAKQLDKNFILLGEKDNPFPYIKAADIFVLPSKEDPFPLVVLEAMALGKPIIAFEESGGVSEQIKNCGILIKNIDAKALAKSISKLIKNKNEANQMGERAKIEQTKYNKSLALQKINDLVSGMLNLPLKKDEEKKVSIVKKFHRALNLIENKEIIRKKLGNSQKIKWWFVYGIERSGTSLITKLISNDSKIYFSDADIREKIKAAFKIIKTDKEKKTKLKKLFEELMKFAEAGKGDYLDFVFKQAGATYEEYLVLVEMFGQPERIIYSFREPESYINSAKKHFGAEKLRNMQQHYEDYLNSDVYDKIGGDIFEYHSKLQLKDYENFLRPIKIDKTIEFVYKGIKNLPDTTKNMRKAYLRFKDKYADKFYKQNNSIKDKISVILPSYNYDWCISQAIESVINQTYKNWELIIIDDNSSDKSLSLIKKYVNKYPDKIKFILKDLKNKGLSQSYKQGIEKATGEFITFIEADDMLTEDSLESRIKILKKNSDVCLVFNGVKLFGSDNVLLENQIAALKNHFRGINFPENCPFDAYDYLSYRNIILTFSSVMVRKGVLHNLDYSNEYQAWFDWWFYSQISLRGKFFFLKEKKTFWRIHNKSYNQNYLREVDAIEKARIMREKILAHKEKNLT